MSPTNITVQIDHADLPPGPIQGFRFFWAYYVNGFNQSVHCQPCFKGSVSKQLSTATARSGVMYTMDERRSFEYLYICGVGVGPRNLLYQKNFHLPLKLAAGAREARQTYNGYTITVENGLALPIPELEDGWKGLDRETTRCKNFRFAVSRFGWKDRPLSEA
jgi:hypothetical protein